MIGVGPEGDCKMLPQSARGVEYQWSRLTGLARVGSVVEPQAVMGNLAVNVSCLPVREARLTSNGNRINT